jgi:hypothetical protein
MVEHQVRLYTQYSKEGIWEMSVFEVGPALLLGLGALGTSA